jgi:hypothetical protein
MVELTLRHGLCLYSPVAYARYGQVLVSMGHNELGIRLGRCHGFHFDFLH